MIRMSPSRDVRELMQDFKQQGFVFEKTSAGHIKAIAPDGAICFMPSTPGDHRSVLNARAKLRRMSRGAA